MYCTLGKTCILEESMEKPKKGPSFVANLYRLFHDPHLNTDIADWSTDGSCLIIHDKARFSSNVLPQFYKHNNFSSFARQLYVYTRDCKHYTVPKTHRMHYIHYSYSV